MRNEMKTFESIRRDMLTVYVVPLVLRHLFTKIVTRVLYIVETDTKLTKSEVAEVCSGVESLSGCI